MRNLRLLTVQQECLKHPWCLCKAKRPHDDHRDLSCKFKTDSGCLIMSPPSDWNVITGKRVSLKRLRCFANDLANALESVHPDWKDCSRCSHAVSMGMEVTSIRKIMDARSIILELIDEMNRYDVTGSNVWLRKYHCL